MVNELLDPGQDEDLVVHRQPEQDREDEDRDPVLDGIGRPDAEQEPSQPSWKTRTTTP